VAAASVTRSGVTPVGPPRAEDRRRAAAGTRLVGPLGPVLGGCLVGFSISWNIANAGSVATLLAHRYGTGLAVIGLLTTVLFFSELAVMVPGGRAIDRYGAKRMGLVAIVISLVANALLVFLEPAPLGRSALAMPRAGIAGRPAAGCWRECGRSARVGCSRRAFSPVGRWV
jgi:hypothetical protein